MKYCPKCHTWQRNDAVNCPDCGAELERTKCPLRMGTMGYMKKQMKSIYPQYHKPLTPEQRDMKKTKRKATDAFIREMQRKCDLLNATRDLMECW